MCISKAQKSVKEKNILLFSSEGLVENILQKLTLNKK